MDNDTKKIIDDLKRQVDDLSSRLRITETNLSQHTHKGNDGSSFIYNEGINLKPGQQFQTGNFGVAEYTGSPEGTFIQRGFLVIGDDMNSTDGFDNAMITLEHQPTTNGVSNQTFYYGFRGKAYVGNDGAVTSGGTLFSTSKVSFVINSLVGETILVFDPANPTQFDGFLITANSENTITIDGTWTFTGSGCTYMVFVPIYMGSAQYPWRRLYTTQGSGGGIRFGLGDTNGGQNGLLYMDLATGNLKWRKPDGTTTTVTVT